jgi:hypothetical protein
MTGNSFDKDFWARVLDEHGLESPGYQEAKQDAIELAKRKKEQKEAIKPRKSKKK